MTDPTVRPSGEFFNVDERSGSCRETILPFLYALSMTIFLPSLLSADVHRLTPTERAFALQECTEYAQNILVGTIVDTSVIIRPNSDLWTRYTVQIDEVLKGDLSEGTTTTFTSAGGCTPRFHSFVDPSPTFALGTQHLLFMATCPNIEESRLVYPSCLAQLKGSRAFTYNPGVDVDRLALVDSIDTFLTTCSAESQKESSDLVVVVTVQEIRQENPRLGPAHSASSITATVGPTLHQVSGPALSIGTEVDLISPECRGPLTLVPGSKAPLEVDKTYIAFLEYRDDHWYLRPSVYAAWEHVNADAEVNAIWYGCGPYRLSTRTWSGLIDLLSR